MRQPRFDISDAGAADGVTSRRKHLAELCAAGFFVVFLAIQILVPIVQLISAPRPARWGWQMYSVASAQPRFELLLRDGSSKPIDITPYVTSMRGDVPLARFLPAHLCALFPDAVTVHYHMDDGSQAGTFQCER
ncbi:MAG TPA: hypothetical protein VKE41_00215 [Roseiflexaceae bacterium]|nr:hypothetical protein [Roseiflexaceae bacterium]